MISHDTNIRSALKSKQRGFFTMPGAIGMCKPTIVSGGYTPLSLPNLKGWYDSSDSATRILVSGEVSQWNDKSGNARHATQTTPSNRYSLSTASVNGLDAFSADGIGFMDLNGGGIVLQAPNFYLFVVGGATRSCAFVSTYSGNPAEYGIFPYDDGNLYMWSGGTGGDYLYMPGIGASTTDGSINLMGVMSAASGSTMVFNNTTTDTQTAPGGLGLSAFTGHNFGTDARLQGKVCEIIFGQATLTTTEITDLRNYLKTKWGTP